MARRWRGTHNCQLYAQVRAMLYQLAVYDPYRYQKELTKIR